MAIDIKEIFDKYADNMSSILGYIKYKKGLHDYRQGRYKIYQMIPYIKEAIDTTILIKIYGFFDKKYGLTLENLLEAAEKPQPDKNAEVLNLRGELADFKKTNATIKNSIIGLRNVRAHVNLKDQPSNITADEVDAVVKWIKEFINKLHRLCELSSLGYSYANERKSIYGDVLDVLKRPEVQQIKWRKDPRLC